jgi:alkanesulfonate monooxygenase
MAIEFIGSVVPAHAADVVSDPDYPIQAAALVDEAGFDKLLIGYSAGAPDGMLVANEVLTTTSRLGVMVTQVPGLVAPTVAARQFATLAAFHPGRVSLHAIGDAALADAQRDGDWIGPFGRASRAAEFIELIGLTWRSQRPFDYAGEFYQVTGAYSAARPQGGHLQLCVSYESVADLPVSAQHADVCLLAAAPVPEIAGRIARLRAAAARYGRSPRFGVSLRLQASPARRTPRDRLRFLAEAGPPTAPGWLPPAASAPIRLAGSYDEVARGLLEYIELGVSTLVIGHDPQAEGGDCAEVIARVQELANGGRRLVI